MSFKTSANARTIVRAPFHRGDLSFETGWIAKQAGGAVVVRQGDTMVLVTVCTAPAKQDQDFFPLVVEYQEKAYAAGKIPGGFIKREGRPAEVEILTSRLIDRPVRPLFADGFFDEVQIICTVLSADGVNSPDMLAICGAGAALEISPLPFLGPLAGVRVGRIGGKLVINPSKAELESADIHFIVAGTRDSIVMVEGGAQGVPEPEVLDALYFGHQELQKVLDLQTQLREKAGKPKMEFTPPERTEAIHERIHALSASKVLQAIANPVKADRRKALSEIVQATKETLATEFPERERYIGKAIEELIDQTNRDRIVRERRRIDGRGLTDVRPIECEVGVVPRAHGSALFTRGETQAIVTTTLGTSMDA